MSRKSISDDEPRPLWGDQWTLGSFWDALFAIRARIETAGLALLDTEAAETVGVTLQDTAEDLKRLTAEAKRELEGE
jgi:hypothetical protein